MKKPLRLVLFFVFSFCLSLAMAQPVASVSIFQTAGSSPSCAGTADTFVAIPANGGSSPTYRWYVNGALISGVTGPIYGTTALPAGSPYVYCILTSNLSGVAGSPATSDTLHLSVYAHPTATISGTASICAGDSAPLTLHLTGTGPFSGKLSDSTFFSGASDTITIPVSPALTATYRIATLSDSIRCTASSLTGSAVITVHSRPTARDSGTATICAGTATTITLFTTGTGTLHGTLSNGLAFSGSGTIHIPVTPLGDTTYSVATLNDTYCPAIASGLTDSAVITVIQRPTVMVSDSDTICSGSAAAIIFTLSDGGPWQLIYTANGSHPDTITALNSSWFVEVSPAITTTYRVTALTSGACAARSTDITGTGLVVVNPTPVAVIDALPAASECLKNNSFSFKASHSTISSGTIANYHWTFDGLSPDTASGPTPIVQFTDTASSALVALYITSSKGCTDSATTRITVRPSPNGAFTVSDTATCAGAAISATAAADSGATYIWSWGDTRDTCHCDSLSHAYTTYSDKRPKLFVTNIFGCTDTSSLIVHVHPLPQALFTVNDTASCYQGNDFIFSDHSTLASAYGDTLQKHLWNFGDQSAIPDSIHLSHSYTANTRTTYTAIENVISSFGCVGTYQKHLAIYKTPSASISINAPRDSICAGTPYTLTASSDATHPRYRWSTGDSLIASISRHADTPSFAPVQAIYTVTVTDTANNRCMNTDTFIVSSLPIPPTPIINDSAHLIACSNSTLHFEVTNIQAGSSYFWYTSPALPISGQNQPYSDITFSTADSNALVYLTTTNAFGCTVGTHDTVVLNGLSGPSVSILAVKDQLDSTLIAIAVPDSGLTYQWGYDTGFTPHTVPGATTQDFLLDSGQNSADYWVIVTDTSTHCSSKVYFESPATTTGIQAINDHIQITLSPNPTTSKFDMTISAAQNQDWTITIFGINGSLIASDKINEATISLSVSTTTWSPGLYLIRAVSAAGDTKVLKLIKE